MAKDPERQIIGQRSGATFRRDAFEGELFGCFRMESRRKQTPGALFFENHPGMLQASLRWLVLIVELVDSRVGHLQLR